MPEHNEPVRLQKYLAAQGLASRRKIEELIIAGKIKVNGKIAELGQKVTPNDQIVVAGQTQQLKKIDLKIIALNKPIGYVTTTSDEHERETVLDLIPLKERLYPVGRLDKNTSGLLLLTNDGTAAYRLTHPKFEIEKEYIVKLNRPLSDNAIKKLLDGITIKGEDFKVDRIHKIGDASYSITLHEGKNREVRKIITSVYREVISLERTRIGNLKLNDLKVGQFKILDKDEIKLLGL